MKKPTTLQKATTQIPGFLEFHERLVQSIAISGKSESMRDNYALHLAKIALRFGCVPTQVGVEQIKKYLFEIKQKFPSPSEAYFKFTVFSLRYAYKMEGMTQMHVQMPTVKHEKKLPVVLSKTEMRKMLDTPKLQKHKLLLSMLYGCGLRCMEVRNIKLTDLDFNRQMLHIRQGKGGKDRYVPIGSYLSHQLQQYTAKKKPNDWLFNGKYIEMGRRRPDRRYSQRGIQWVITQMAKKALIHKPISVHTLRHTFATHLLEDGLDIVSIKELLGHARIETTMIYLHVVQLDQPRIFSPMDTLYGLRKPNEHALLNQFQCPAIKLLQNENQVLQYLPAS